PNRNRIVVSTKLEFKSFEGGNDLSPTITRLQFERLNNDPFRRTLKSLERVLKDAGMEEDMDDVVVPVGRRRQEQLPYHINPKNTVIDAKRLITRRAEGSDVKKDMKH
ncbi:ATPase with role in protein import into the ER, partial [Tulasnella sp. 408]